MADTPTWERIRIALSASRMSQAALARACNVERAAVSAWVNPDPDKRRNPTSENLFLIAQATGVRLDWLQGGEKDGPESTIDFAQGVRRFSHSKKHMAERDTEDLVREADPTLLQNFGHVFEILDYRFDYVGQNLVAEWFFVSHAGGIEPNKTLFRSKLWALSLMRSKDAQLHFKREYALLLCSLLDDCGEGGDETMVDLAQQLREEARPHKINVQLVCGSTGLASYIIDKESHK